MQTRMFVYLMTNYQNTVIYTGVTNDLRRRVLGHRSDTKPGFTGRYRIQKLVYFEEFDDSYLAIAREKQIKAGSRQKKIDLIESMNPAWDDLMESFAGFG